MAQQNDRISSIPGIAEEDSSETTLSLPVLNLRLNSSETTETTLSGNVTPLLATDGGPSEGTFASTSGREIRFLPRPNSTTNTSKSNRSETSRRNEFLFLLTTDSSNTSRSEDDDIRVEEEEDESDEKQDDQPNPPTSALASCNVDPRSTKSQLPQSLGSLYREIQFELRPQEADEEVEVLSPKENESKNTAGGNDDPESTLEEEEDNDEGEETIRHGDETDTDHTNTEATDETFSNSNLLSDAVLLLPRIRSHEDSIGSCCDEDNDADDFECTKLFELSHSPEVRRAKVHDMLLEISPSSRTGSKSASTRTNSSSTAHSASHSRKESERSRARLTPGPAPGSPASPHRHERSASKSSSVVSVSNHLTDTPPVPPRRSPNTDDSQLKRPSLRTSTKVSSEMFSGTETTAPFSTINRRPSSPVFKDLTFEATKIITPSHSPLLSAAAPNSSRVQRVDGEDAPEVPTTFAAAASTSLAARLEKPKNLYEELLQYHREHEDEESTEQGTAFSGFSRKQSLPSGFEHRTQGQFSYRSQSVGSLQSFEDAKLPAQELKSHQRSDSNPSHYPYYEDFHGVRRRPSTDLAESHADARREQPLQSRTSLSHLEADEAIARILQEELDAEQRRTEEESLRAALALQRQEEEELNTRQQHSSTNDNLLPLVLPEGTSMDEQRRILEQIRQQQEEAQLRQALNMSSHSSPDVTCVMANGPSLQINAPGNRSPPVSHVPRYPPPQPHAYPHRRSTSHGAHFADDFSEYGESVRGGSVNSTDGDHRLPSLGSTQSFGSVQPAATFPSSSMSDAFERQFRPRDASWAQPSAQRHRLASSSDSFRHRPNGSGPDTLPPNSVDHRHSAYRPEWERSQQEALREFQQQKYLQEQPHPYRGAIQQLSPTIPYSPASQLDLVRRGAAETARAVQVGRAHIVQCQNCQARLQAPIQYALVYCPSCGMVSPGRSYVPSTIESASSNINSSGYASSEHGATSPSGSSLQGGDASSDRKNWN